jgi:hypothetical protein
MSRDCDSMSELPNLTYIDPASVVGGARRSGFCLSIGMFCGPRIMAPKDPLIGSGVDFVSIGHRTLLGSSLASTTVELGLRAEETEAGAALTRTEEKAREHRTKALDNLNMMGTTEIPSNADR